MKNKSALSVRNIAHELSLLSGAAEIGLTARHEAVKDKIHCTVFCEDKSLLFKVSPEYLEMSLDEFSKRFLISAAKPFKGKIGSLSKEVRERILEAPYSYVLKA